MTLPGRCYRFYSRMGKPRQREVMGFFLPVPHNWADIRISLFHQKQQFVLRFWQRTGKYKDESLHAPSPLFPRTSFFRWSDNPHSPEYQYLMSTYKCVPYYASHQGCYDDWNLSLSQDTSSSVNHLPVRWGNDAITERFKRTLFGDPGIFLEGDQLLLSWLV